MLMNPSELVYKERYPKAVAVVNATVVRGPWPLRAEVTCSDGSGTHDNETHRPRIFVWPLSTICISRSGTVVCGHLPHLKA